MSYIPESVELLPRVTHRRVAEHREQRAYPILVHLHRRQERTLARLLRLVKQYRSVLPRPALGLLRSITVTLILRQLRLIHRVGAYRHGQGINKRIGRHTQPRCYLYRAAAPHLPVHLRLQQPRVARHTAEPPLVEQRQIPHAPSPRPYGIGDIRRQVHRIRIRKICRERQQLLQRRVYPETYLRRRYSLRKVNRCLVQLRHRRTVRTRRHLAHILECLPQLRSRSVGARHIHHLVAEPLVRQQRVQIAVELRKRRPLLHLLQMVQYHRQCIRSRYIQCQVVAPTLDDASRRGGGRRRGVARIRSHVHFLRPRVLQYLQREIILYRRHRCAEHSPVNLVVLVPLSYKILLLQPVAKLHELRVELLLDSLDVVFRDSHLAQLHPPVAHLVHHVDIQQVPLRQHMLLHLPAVHELNLHRRQLAVQAEKRTPFHPLLPPYLLNLGVQLLQRLAVT